MRILTVVIMCLTLSMSYAQNKKEVIESLTEELDKCRADNVNLNQKIDKVSSELMDREDYIKQQDSKMNVLAEEVSNLKQKNSELDQQKAELSSTIDSLKNIKVNDEVKFRWSVLGIDENGISRLTLYRNNIEVYTMNIWYDLMLGEQENIEGNIFLVSDGDGYKDYVVTSISYGGFCINYSAYGYNFSEEKNQLIPEYSWLRSFVKDGDSWRELGCIGSCKKTTY